MQQLCTVHNVERIQQRHQNAIELRLRRWPAEGREPLPHLLALDVAEHRISRPVRLEVINHVHDARVLTFAERFGFLEKAIQPPAEQALPVRRADHMRAVAGSELAGKILFQREQLGGQPIVPGPVRDAEAPGADDFLDHVVPDGEARLQRHEPRPPRERRGSRAVALSARFGADVVGHVLRNPKPASCRIDQFTSNAI